MPGLECIVCFCDDVELFTLPCCERPDSTARCCRACIRSLCAGTAACPQCRASMRSRLAQVPWLSRGSPGCATQTPQPVPASRPSTPRRSRIRRLLFTPTARERAAIAAAHAPAGLVLSRSANSGSGYSRVSIHRSKSGKLVSYKAKRGRNEHLGSFPTAAAAAVAVALAARAQPTQSRGHAGRRYAAVHTSSKWGPVRAAAAAAALTSAAREGLVLAESSRNCTGFAGVSINEVGRFFATARGQHLGAFRCPEEAALARARALALHG